MADASGSVIGSDVTEFGVHDGAIGVFDSGLGGLTVVQALADLLPSEDLVYVGDTARYPYGPRPADELQRFSLQIGGWLIERGVKMLVVACNSATAAALGTLRDAFDVPVIGVVAPGVRAALSATTTGEVAVIGTAMTVQSGIYERTAAELRAGLRLRSRACPDFVRLVEDGDTVGPRARAVVEAGLEGLIDEVDTLVLGCTHFPLLGRTLSEVVGQRVTLVSSADETAFEVRDILGRTGMARAGTNAGSRLFFTSGDADRFAALGERFLGWPLGTVARWVPPTD